MQAIIVRQAKSIESLRKGTPWVFADAIEKVVDGVQNGAVIKLKAVDGAFLGTGYFNSKSKVCCRILTKAEDEPIDTAFFVNRFTKAMQYRDKLFQRPFYRLIHAEGDRMPGLVIDRFADVLVCQTSTLGMEQLKPVWLPALLQVLNPKTVIFKDDVPARAQEGLDLNVSIAYGEPVDTLSIMENDIPFFAQPMSGQKTGWFYDQRANRAWVKAHAANARVADLYTYCGGFGIHALSGGAQSVTFVDRSEEALAQIQQTTMVHNQEQIEFIRADVYDYLQFCIENQQTFDLVIADPPAFIKNRDHHKSGLKGYEKLAKLCAQIVAPNGKLLIASCSHHASPSEFRRAVESGIRKTNQDTNANRQAKLIYQGEADKDHPVHPHLPQTRYLKALGYVFEG